MNPGRRIAVAVVSLGALVGLVWWIMAGSGVEIPADGLSGSRAEADDRSLAEAEAAEQAGPGAGDAASDTEPRQREAADRWNIHGGAFVLRGVVKVPWGESLPENTRVFAVRHDWGGRVPDGLFPRALASGKFQARPDLTTGEFELMLPPGAEEENWMLCAGGLGWVGSSVFPDPRPRSPLPTDLQEIHLTPTYAATFELRGKDGQRVELSREWLRQNGGPGVYHFGGWSIDHPAREDSLPALLSVPSDFPPIVGDRAPDRGLAGKEAALEWEFTQEAWEEGFVDRNFEITLPGYRTVEQGVRFGAVAKGETPHHVIELEALLPAGELWVELDGLQAWRDVVEEAGLGELQLTVTSLDPPAAGSEPTDAGSRSAKSKEGKTVWTCRYPEIPKTGQLRFPGIPVGRYRLQLVANESDVPVPLSQTEIGIEWGDRTTVTADLSDFGLLEFDLAPDMDHEWAQGRFVISIGDGEVRPYFRESAWPVVVGPLRASEPIAYFRARKEKKSHPMAKREGGDSTFPVVAGATSRYEIIGLWPK